MPLETCALRAAAYLRMADVPEVLLAQAATPRLKRRVFRSPLGAEGRDRRAARVLARRVRPYLLRTASGGTAGAVEGSVQTGSELRQVLAAYSLE